MIKSSSNAILAKSHAMYGKRLSEHNYNDLLNCKSVSEIATYLRLRTRYSAVFDSSATQVSSMRRGQLESLLRRFVTIQFDIFAKYQLFFGLDLYQLLLNRTEVDFLLSRIRYINTEVVKEQDYSLSYLHDLSELSFIDILNAKTNIEFLQALKGSEYHSLLKPYLIEFDPIYGKLLIEGALYQHRYKSILRFVERGTRDKGLIKVLKTQNDIRTIKSLFRLKRTFGNNYEMALKFLLPDLSNLDGKVLLDLAAAESTEKFLSLLTRTQYSFLGLDPDNLSIDRETDLYLFKWHLQKFRFSFDPEVVMFCYIFLLENEIKNIINIIEGVRYGLPRNEIVDLLIGADGFE